MRYKAIFIDIDDTLLDYVPCCRAAFDEAIESLSGEIIVPPEGKEAGLSVKRSVSESGLSVEDGLFDLFFSISRRLFGEAKHGLHTVAEVMELYPLEFCERAGYGAQAADPFKHAFRAAWGTTHALVPGAKETLEALKNKGYRLFAASNSFGHLQRSRLSHAGLLDYFEDTYISMDIGFDKPDLRFYEAALRRCGLQASEVLMVGDSMTTDIIGARAAGIDAVYFNRYLEPLTEAHDSIPVIHSLPELIDLV